MRGTNRLALSLAIVIVGAFHTYTNVVYCLQACKQIRQRQEIRTLTQGQRNSFFNAIRQLQSGAKPTNYDRFVEKHYQARISAHGWPWFLTWHRVFIRDFEQSLQTIDDNVMLPYWDWSYDSQAPEMSPIFKNNWFGGNGRPSDNCVVDGQFASWQPSYPNVHCLRRKWDQGSAISAFHSPETIKAIAHNSTGFDQFRKQLEAPTHGQVHNNIGGDMPSMYSPNDPLFWVHHAFIDKTWYEWQRLRPENAKSYGGRNADNTPANINDRLTPYPLKVADVLDTRNLCYTYAPFRDTPVHRRRRGLVSDLQATAYSATGTNPINMAEVDGLKLPEVITKALPISVAGILDTPSFDDRSEIMALRDCKPLPEPWLQMNGLNVTQVRHTETMIRGVVKRINLLPDYISPVSLIAQPRLLGALAARNHTFTATKGDRQWVVTVATDALGKADVVGTVAKVRELLGLRQLAQGKSTLNGLTGLIGADGTSQLISNYGI